MLIFTLKKEWYEKIRSGEKTVEYREVKPYWTKRIAAEIARNYPNENKKYCLAMTSIASRIGSSIEFKVGECRLRLGYTDRYLSATVSKIETVDGKCTDLRIDKPVYAIHLENVRIHLESD